MASAFERVDALEGSSAPGRPTASDAMVPPPVSKGKFPHLVASSSFFETNFFNIEDLRDNFGDAIRKGDSMELLPSYSAGGASPTSTLAHDKPLKMVSYRPIGEYPTSTGTSKMGVPCFTNGVGPCVAIIISGMSPDSTRAKGRIFHAYSKNTRTSEALSEFKSYLDELGLTQQSAILVGGNRDEKNYEGPGVDAAAEAEKTRQVVEGIKQSIRADDIEIVKDLTCEALPGHISKDSNIGFEFSKDGATGKISLDFHEDVRMN